MTPPKILRQAGTVSFATLLSRVLGYVRDALVAAAFGGGGLTDAFYAAFRIPNLLRRLLGEGPLTAAFVPLFTHRLETGEGGEARRFFQTLFSTLGLLLTGLVILGIVFAPQLVGVVAWGFRTDPEKFDLTVRLTRVMFPFVLFVCLAAVSSGALNALGHFFVPALAPAMLSVAEIAFIFFLFKLWTNPLDGLAVSALVGGVLHFAVLLPLLHREKMPLRWHWEPRHPEVRRVGLALLPAVWGLSVDQISAFIDTLCASFLMEGSVTALYNSNRLMQLPLALFGIAMSTAALPSLSASLARGDARETKETLNLSLRLVFFTVVPAMVGLIALGTPIVQILFEHGRFTPRATALTASALAGYALGLPAYAAVKVLASAFYAMKDTRTPVRVANISMGVNIAGNLMLMGPWGVGGLAFATAIASVVNAALLFWLLRRRLGLLGGRRLALSLARAAAASLFMGLAAWAWTRWGFGPLALRVTVAVAGGAALYFALARLLRSEESVHLTGLFRRA
ncbi:MAG: murein biosynthesis integral membrane protein MurJ [Elusimicrobia bacterium]|nr:murein biosynthesis integral membrane protein MurJ [Elusimicrobiota bacterium]MBK7206687.1 murein biosynthesis integral membrane protein MurJ [Elusimicrobiota bacterium]MBK7545484.1 murein biosynthesis integral membrane protein MurJ [Elusimicrobiota bacterium]MBK7575326.1 murein biosynthesis integral membrane protein MurJ [Elusimicrobiota bacterium]MBK7687965.1 murein biosynthesis integral membrane protein MurJ [Elusimicrobiota bacterium]